MKSFVRPPLPDILIACLERFTLVASEKTFQSGVVLMPRWKDPKDSVSGQFQVANVAEWHAAIGPLEAKGPTPEAAVLALYDELGNACQRMIGYHEGALKLLQKEVSE